MVTLHENGKVWRLYLRGMYSHIRSEKEFRAMIDRAITRYENNPSTAEYGKALRKLPILKVSGEIFGLISTKRLIK
jgi:hypothetical protein